MKDKIQLLLFMVVFSVCAYGQVQNINGLKTRITNVPEETGTQTKVLVLGDNDYPYYIHKDSIKGQEIDTSKFLVKDSINKITTDFNITSPNETTKLTLNDNSFKVENNNGSRIEWNIDDVSFSNRNNNNTRYFGFNTSSISGSFKKIIGQSSETILSYNLSSSVVSGLDGEYPNDKQYRLSYDGISGKYPTKGRWEIKPTKVGNSYITLPIVGTSSQHRVITTSVNNQFADNNGNITIDIPFKSSGQGYTYKDRPDSNANNGVIGQQSFDLGRNDTAWQNGTQKGALGRENFVVGWNNVTKNYLSTSFGQANDNDGYSSVTFGEKNKIITTTPRTESTPFPNTSRHNLVSGGQNTVTDTRYALVHGGANRVTNSATPVVLGVSNTVNNVNSNITSYVIGNSNTINGTSAQNFIVGTRNKIDNGGYNSIIGSTDSNITNVRGGTGNTIFGGVLNNIEKSSTSSHPTNSNTTILGGLSNTAVGYMSTVLGGQENKTITAGETLTGILATVQDESLDPYNYISDSRMFGVGVGYTTSNDSKVRRDGLNVYRNGLVTTPTTTNSLIDSNTKAVVTREYLENKIADIDIPDADLTNVLKKDEENVVTSKFAISNEDGQSIEFQGEYSVDITNPHGTLQLGSNDGFALQYRNTTVSSYVDLYTGGIAGANPLTNNNWSILVNSNTDSELIFPNTGSARVITTSVNNQFADEDGNIEVDLSNLLKKDESNTVTENFALEYDFNTPAISPRTSSIYNVIDGVDNEESLNLRVRDDNGEGSVMSIKNDRIRFYPEEGDSDYIDIAGNKITSSSYVAPTANTDYVQKEYVDSKIGLNTMKGTTANAVSNLFNINHEFANGDTSYMYMATTYEGENAMQLGITDDNGEGARTFLTQTGLKVEHYEGVNGINITGDKITSETYNEPTTDNDYVQKAYIDLRLPAPPTLGCHTLQSNNNVVQWVPCTQ